VGVAEAGAVEAGVAVAGVAVAAGVVAAGGWLRNHGSQQPWRLRHTDETRGLSHIHQ
jgi:hypothetical protein